MEKESRKRILEGVVVSDKMNKTRVVEVIHLYHHPIYLKRIKRRKRYKIHDEHNQTKVGDRVKFIECRPLSKEKRFRLLEVIK